MSSKFKPWQGKQPKRRNSVGAEMNAHTKPGFLRDRRERKLKEKSSAHQLRKEYNDDLA